MISKTGKTSVAQTTPPAEQHPLLDGLESGFGLAKRTPIKVVNVCSQPSEIATSFPQASWHHVRSFHNPVDCATRGLTTKQVAEDNLGWQVHPGSLYPAESGPPSLECNRGKTEVCVAQEAHKAESNEESDGLLSLQNFSSYSKKLRILAYCRRWRLSTSNKNDSKSYKYLTVQELSWARTACFRLIQQHHYASVIDCLRTNQSLPKRSSIARLAPFPDKQGLIRIGGRLANDLI